MKSPLPIVNGVGPSCKHLPAGRWKTILDFLQEQYPKIKTETWLSRMAKGQVVDEKGDYLNPGSPYRVGASIFYYREPEPEPIIPFDEWILYQDEHILVSDKPHFLPVVPSGRFLHETLLIRLKKKRKLESLVPTHRIDRETAGIVLFSLNPATRGYYTSLFQNRKIEKVYQALAGSHPEFRFPLTRRSRIVTGEPFFRMTEVEGEPNSETYIAELKKMNDLMLYQVRLLTGRKHQIRVHFSALGIPIVHDKLYPQMSYEKDDDFSKPLKLLAKSVSFQDPLTGRNHHFESHRKL